MRRQALMTTFQLRIFRCFAFPVPQVDRLNATQRTLESNISRLYETAKTQIEERDTSLNAARVDLLGERVSPGQRR